MGSSESGGEFRDFEEPEGEQPSDDTSGVARFSWLSGLSEVITIAVSLSIELLSTGIGRFRAWAVV